MGCRQATGPRAEPSSCGRSHDGFRAHGAGGMVHAANTAARRPPGNCSLLRWADAHWLNAAAITALGTIAAIIAPFLSRRGHGQRSQGRAAGRQGRERARTLRRIQYRRAREAQIQAPADAARLALGLTRRPDICQLSATKRPHAARALPLPAGRRSSAFSTMYRAACLSLALFAGQKPCCRNWPASS